MLIEFKKIALQLRTKIRFQKIITVDLEFGRKF